MARKSTLLMPFRLEAKNAFWSSRPTGRLTSVEPGIGLLDLRHRLRDLVSRALRRFDSRTMPTRPKLGVPNRWSRCIPLPPCKGQWVVSRTGEEDASGQTTATTESSSCSSESGRGQAVTRGLTAGEERGQVANVVTKNRRVPVESASQQVGWKELMRLHCRRRARSLHYVCE